MAATTIEELNVIISANKEELAKALRSVQTDLDKLQKRNNKVTTKMGNAFQKLKTIIATTAVGKAIQQSLAVGMEAIETASLFTTTLGSEMATEVNKWSMEVADALGLSNTNLQRNIGVIYNIAMAMGVATDNSLKMAKGVSVLAEDMASFYNVAPEEMFNKIRSALIGVYKPLQDLGIRLDEDTIKQVAYAKGIAAVGTELNNEQLILARYEAILERTSAAQGDLGRTLESPANQTRIFKNNIRELWLALSRFLIPVYTYLITIINHVIVAITKAINVFANLFGLSSTNKIEQGIESPVKRVTAGLGDANKEAKKLKGTLASFDEMNVLQEQDSGTSGAAGISGGASGYQLDDYMVNMGEMSEKAQAIGKTIGTVIETVSEKFAEVFEYLKPAFTWLSEAIDNVINFVIDNWPTISAILVGVATAMLIWKGYFAALNLVPRIMGVINAVSLLWNLIATNPIVAVIAVIGGLIAAFITAYNTNEEFRKKVDETFLTIKETITGVIDKIKTKFDEVRSKVTGVAAKIREAFSTAGDIFKGFKEGLESTFKTIVNGVIKGINKVIAWPLNKINTMLNKIRAISILGFQPFINSWSYNPIYVPQIPLLERGGVLKRGQIGLLEGKGAEAVVPLERNTEWLDRIAERLNSNAGQPIQVVVKIGESTIIDKIIDGINEKEFRTGKAVLNV